MQAFGGQPGSRADLLYGATNTTKTTQLAYAADYIRERTGKKSRLVSADPGGWDAIQSSVDDGTIQAFALIQHRANIYETMEKLTLGWWPEDVHDPQSRLLPPAQNGIKDIGGLFFEGLTSWCDIMMRTNVTDLENINVPRSIAEKENLLKSGSFVHRFSSQTDYGSIQDIIAELVRNSGMLPLYRVIWTALEQKGEDDQKRPTYGPDIIGRKATAKCGPWFGNFLHLDHVLVSEQVADPVNKDAKLTVQKPKPYMFLRNHIDPNDPTKLPWPAKTRAPRTLWQKVPDMMEPRLDKFYALLENLLAEEKREREQAKLAIPK